MDRTAARFLLVDARSVYTCPDVFPSREVAILRLSSLLEQKEAHVSALLTAQTSKYKARVVSHWTDLAPNSSQSRTAVSLEHLRNVQAYIRQTQKYLRSVLEQNITRGITRRTLSVFVSETQTIPSMLAAVTGEESLSAPLQRCVASETRLQRLERYRTFGTDNPAGDSAGGTGSFDSFRHLPESAEMRPTAVRRASEFESIGETAQVVYLRQLVSSLRDAVFPIGKRVAELHRSVPTWIEKQYEGATICRRISALVESIVRDAREEFWSLSGHDKRSNDDDGESTMDDGDSGLAEDVTTALVEDEVFSHALLSQLRSVLSDPAQSAITAECQRCASMSQASLHVPKLYQSDDPFAYAEPIAMLSTIPMYLTPSRKLDVLRSASKRLLLEMKRIAAAKGKDDLTVGGDDFIPTFMFCTIMSNMRDMSFEASFLQHGMAPSCRHSELGYYATTLEFTAEFIKNMAQQRVRKKDSVLMASSSRIDERSPSIPPHDEMAVAASTQFTAYVLLLDADRARSWAASAHLATVVVRENVVLDGFAAVADEQWCLNSLRPVRIVAVSRPNSSIRHASLLRLDVGESQFSALSKLIGDAKLVSVAIDESASSCVVDAMLPSPSGQNKITTEITLDDGSAHDAPPANVKQRIHALGATLQGPLGALASVEPLPTPVVEPYESPSVISARQWLNASQLHLQNVVLQLQTYLVLAGFLPQTAPDVFVTGYGDLSSTLAIEAAASAMNITTGAIEEKVVKLFPALAKAVATCIQTIQTKKPLPSLQEVQSALALWQGANGIPAYFHGRLDITSSLTNKKR